MPDKLNINGRHHIPKMKFQVTNWAEYETGFYRIRASGQARAAAAFEDQMASE